MRLPPLFSLFFGLAVLAGCASWEEVRDNSIEGTDIAFESFDDASETINSYPTKSEDYLQSRCPPVKLVNELGTFYDFNTFKSPTEQNLITRVKVGRLSTNCNYTDRSVTVDISLIFEGLLGPAAMRGAPETFFTYPYFIAIMSPTGQLMAREIFAVPMTYGPGQSYQTHTENLRQIIPIERPSDGTEYDILVGFQLNKDQLAYTRALEKARKKAEKNREKEPEAEVRPLNIPMGQEMIIQQPGTPAVLFSPPPSAAPRNP